MGLYLQPRVIKHADIGFSVAPGGPAVAGRRSNAPPRRTGVPAEVSRKSGPESAQVFFPTARTLPAECKGPGGVQLENKKSSP